MEGVLKLRDAWGASHFETTPEDTLARFELSGTDRDMLATVGLPMGPAPALHLEMRFESLDIHHFPKRLSHLSETSFQPSKFYPRTGDPSGVDAWANLDRFVVLGEVPNDFKGAFFCNRFVCLDADSGRVCWVYATPSRHGHSSCCALNTTLLAYLGSLLAYKRFRDQWPALRKVYDETPEAYDDPRYLSFAERVYADFCRELEEADPTGFEGGFWDCHAGNEAILLEL
jgi:hypothetical protein